MAKKRHIPYHDHVTHEHEKDHNSTHHIAKHYNEHSHRDHEHPANHRNEHDKGHHTDHQREHHNHNGTHPHHRSEHSHNRVSNPNVAHHNAVHEHNTHDHTYIHHQEGKKQNVHHQSPNKIPKAPVTKNPNGKPPTGTKPGTKPPTGTKPVNPVTPTKPPVGTKSPTGTPGTKPTHNGVNIGIGNPPTSTKGKQNAPGVYTPSVSDYSNSFAPSTANGTPANATYNKPYPSASKDLGSTLHNIGHKVLQAFTNFGVWESNTVSGRHDPYETDQSKVQLTAKDVQHGIANDYVHTMHNIAVWERDRLHDIGIDVVP